jgi:hypothetical protein
MRVCGFNGRSVDDETEQQKGEHASKRSVRPEFRMSFSGHVFEQCVRVLTVI